MGIERTIAQAKQTFDFIDLLARVAGAETNSKCAFDIRKINGDKPHPLRSCYYARERHCYDERIDGGNFSCFPYVQLN